MRKLNHLTGALFILLAACNGNCGKGAVSIIAAGKTSADTTLAGFYARLCIL